HAAGGEPTAAAIDEHGGGLDALFAEIAKLAPVRAQRVECDLADRHDALLASLAEHPHALVLEVDVLPVEADELADAQARGVERFEDRAVPRGPGVAARQTVQQALGVVDRQEYGQPLLDLRSDELRGGIAPDLAAQGEERKEAANRRDFARHRGSPRGA